MAINKQHMKKYSSYLLALTIALTAVLGITVSKQAFASHNSSPQPPVDSARLAEYQLLYQYVQSAPKVPKKTIKSLVEQTSLLGSFQTMSDISTFSGAIPFMSSTSKELLAQTPLFVSDVDSEAADAPATTISKIEKPKIYKGGQYGSLRYTERDSRGKKTKSTIYFIKQDGQWKFDFIQSLKKEIKK